MAISRVTVNSAGIRSFMERSPLAGTSVGAGRGMAGGDAHALAARMALAARINGATMFKQRTGDLVSSVVPIVLSGRGRGTVIGVGTTMKHGAVLEVGSEPHIIRPQVPFRGRGKGGYFLRSNGPRSKGGNPDPLDRPQMLVQAPGLEGRNWMSNAVRSVLPGAAVRVQVHKDLRGSDGR